MRWSKGPHGFCGCCVMWWELENATWPMTHEGQLWLVFLFCLLERKESIFLDFHNLTPNHLQDIWQSFWLFDTTQHKVLFCIAYPFYFSALIIMINDILYIYYTNDIGNMGIWIYDIWCKYNYSQSLEL